MALIGKHHQPELEKIAKNYGFYVHRIGQYDVIFKAKQTDVTVTWYFTKGTVLVQPGNKSIKPCNVKQFTTVMEESMPHPSTGESKNGREVLRNAFRFNNVSSTQPPIRTGSRPMNPRREYETQGAGMDAHEMGAVANRIKHEQLNDEQRQVAPDVFKHEQLTEEQRIKHEQLTDVIKHEHLTNEQKEVALDVMSGRNVFITGPAGTGKSYLFKYLIQKLYAQYGENFVAVTASTGIAAVNVDGVTIHSFAGIGLAKENKEQLLQKVSKNKNACGNWRKTKVLMIDEISMLGSELFTKLAYIGARLNNKFNIPFGGIQVVLCGDFFQLPPVKLGTATVGSFAFDSPDWKKLNVKMWKLKEIIRQKDSEFIELLNKVRRGDIDHADIDLLETCHTRIKPVPQDGIIPTKLMCINKDVDLENNQKLKQLRGEETKLAARDTIVYSKVSVEKLKEDIEKNAPGMLALKEGAQVVLLRNIDVRKKLVNGTRGVVDGFEEKTFKAIHSDRKSGKKICGTFLCPIIRWTCGVRELLHPIEFGYHNPLVGKILRVQFPLKLAWSLTVHKSQGMTLSRAEITVGNAFENGQVYVALSRCVSLDGLWMSGDDRLSPEAVKAHHKVKEFYNQGGIKNESLKPSGIKRQASSDMGYGGNQWPPKMKKREFASEMGNFTVDGEGFTEVHTDGACPDNGKANARAGVGVWWGHGHKLNVSRPVLLSKQTNNAAEIQAASIAIEQAVANGVKRLRVNTDSQFLIDCVTKWMSNWKKNGWMTSSKQPVKNREDLEELDRAMNSGTIQVKWKHVKGHAGIEGNEEADKLAVRGAYMTR